MVCTLLAARFLAVRRSWVAVAAAGALGWIGANLLLVVLADGDWDDRVEDYADHLLSICDRFAPGTSDLVVDTFTLHPKKIESYFGIRGGHIHHVDNTVAFNQRMPYATGLDGLYAGSAGTHPAGSVIGAGGHNAATRILRDLGRA